MSKLVDVIPVLKKDSSVPSSPYQSIAPPLSVSYTKPETDTLSDLIAPTLKKWCQEFSINIDSADVSIVPNCVSSGHKPLLARHWKIIVAKVTKSKPSEPSPMEDTDGTLNVDKLLSISYKRTLAAPDIASMPQIWLAPISAEATKFASAMRERYDAITSKAKHELEKEKQQISAPPPSTSGSSQPEKSDPGKKSAAPSLLSVAALIHAESAKKENNNNNKSISVTPNVAVQQKSSVSPLPKMGIISQHSLERERLPESVAKINKYFDQVYTDFVEKKIWLFRYDEGNDNNNNIGEDSTQKDKNGKTHEEDIHDEKCYVHWSDILKSGNKNPVFREGKSLKNFQGDKSSLNEALGAAWEAAAEAEEHALTNWNALQAEKKKNLESQIAADEEQIKDAEKRQQDMKAKSESMMVKKAEIQVKEDRLKIIQEEIAAMELRLETAKQVKAEIEDEKRQEAEKQAEIRETLMKMEYQQQQQQLSQRNSSSRSANNNYSSSNKSFGSSYSPNYLQTSSASLQSAMSVLNPTTAAQVQRVLLQCDEQQLHATESAKRNRLVVNRNNNNVSTPTFSGSNNTMSATNTPYRNSGGILNSTSDFSRPNYVTGAYINDDFDHSKNLMNQTAATSESILPNTKHTDIRAAMARIHNQYGYESVYTAAASNVDNNNNHHTFTDLSSRTPPPQNPLAVLNVPLHQHHHHSNHNNNTGSNNFPSELKNWQQPGSLSSAIVMQKSHHQHHDNNYYGVQNIDNGHEHHRGEIEGGDDEHDHNNDMRVPLRLLASDLDAFLTRSEKNSEQVLPTFRSRQQEQINHQRNENSNNNNNNRAQYDKEHFLTSSSSTHQNHRKIQSQMMVEHRRHLHQQQGQDKNNHRENVNEDDHDNSNGSEYGDDLETRKRIIHRIHDLKSVLNDPNYRPSGRR